MIRIKATFDVSLPQWKNKEFLFFVKVRVRESLVIPATYYQSTYSTSKMRMFLGGEDILAAPHSLKALFEGSDLVFG